MDLNNILTIKKEEKPMTFIDAVKCVSEVVKIHKLEWQDKEYYGVLRDGKLQLHKPDGKFYDWIIGDGDLYGEDWIVLD